MHHPLLELKLLVRYHGVKATQYFSKFTDHSIAVFKQDLIALRLPHPKVCHVTLLSHGLVECFWPSARKDHVLHKNLLDKTKINPAFEDLTRSLSITSVTLKEKPINSSNLESANHSSLKRPYSQIGQSGRDEATNASGHFRPNKVAKTQAKAFHLHSKSDSSALQPGASNALHRTFQSTVTTPNGPTTALHIPQMKPNPQMVNAPQTHVQSNGVHNATVEEKVVDDFLQNLLSEKLISGPMSSTTTSATLPKSTELQPNNLSNAQNVRHSGTVPVIPKGTVQVPISNPEGIPGLNMATVQMIRQKNPAAHLPTPPSSAPPMNPPIHRNSQNVQPVASKPTTSLPKNVKPANPQPTAVARSSSEQGPNKGDGSKNIYSSTTMEKSAGKPYPAGASYARFDPSKNAYIAVHYSSPTTAISSTPSASGTSNLLRNGSTNPGLKQSNSLRTTLGSSTASSRLPDQRPAVASSVSGVRTTKQGSIYRTLPKAQASSTPSLDLADQHPVFSPSAASFPPNQGPNTTRFTSAGTVQIAPNGNDANSSLPPVDRDHKDLPQLTLMSKTLRWRIEDLVKKDGEIADDLKSLGSAWVPEKLMVVEIGNKGKERERAHDHEGSVELTLLRAKLAAVQKLREEELKVRAEERKRAETGKAELELSKKKLEAVQKLRAEEAKMLAEERKRREEAKNTELELLKTNFETAQKSWAEEANVLAKERKRREEAGNTELGLWKAKLEAIQKLRTEEAKILAEERKRREEAETALADVKRECRQPFVVPSLLDIFVELSKLTTKGLKLTNSGAVLSLGSAGLSLNSQGSAPLPLSGVAVAQAIATGSGPIAGDLVTETLRVKLEPRDTTLLL